MAASQTSGIQTLLEAEKEAAKVVQKARQYRVQKLKDARSEAAKEIEAYRTTKEREFAEYEKDHKSQTSNSQSSIDASTKQQIESLKKGVEKNRAVVVDKILDRVVRCEPKMHRNLKKIEA